MLLNTVVHSLFMYYCEFENFISSSLCAKNLGTRDNGSSDSLVTVLVRISIHLECRAKLSVHGDWHRCHIL